MEIILNEKTYAEKLINDKTVHPKELSYDLNILVRYLSSTGLKRNEIHKYINDFMLEAYPDFNINLWSKYIDKYINKAKKRDLFEIEYVPITQKELDKIREIKNPQKERLLFTLLSLTKLNNLKSKSNNNWVNYDEKIIFQLARVACSERNRNIMIYDLKEAGYVKNSKKTLNIQVCFIDNSSTPVMKLTDMRELGYQYEELKKKTLIRRCFKCGKAFKLKSQNDKTRMCSSCRTAPEKEEQKLKICENCGEPFLCSAKDSASKLCLVCHGEKERQDSLTRMRKLREKKNMLRDQKNSTTANLLLPQGNPPIA